VSFHEKIFDILKKKYQEKKCKKTCVNYSRNPIIIIIINIIVITSFALQHPGSSSKNPPHGGAGLFYERPITASQQKRT